MRYRR